MKSIILASTSPRRSTLLKQLGLKFTVVPSLIEEKFNPRLRPRGQAEALSLKKAQEVADKISAKKAAAVIIAADTFISINDDVLGKPKDDRGARRMLRRLSGKKHSVITGFTIIDTVTKKSVSKSVETFVYFRKLSEKEICDYVKIEKLSDKAGSYAIQGIGAILVEKIEGDYFNIVGLPLNSLALELRKFGVEVLS